MRIGGSSTKMLHKRERDRADRHVDEENPMPGNIVGDVTTDCRPQRRRDDDGDPVWRRRPGSASTGETSWPASPARSAPCRRHRSLEARAPSTKSMRLGASPQSSEAIGEQTDRQHVKALPANHFRKPAADRQDDRIGDEIAGQDPGGLIHAGSERSGDMQQRDIGDRGVEHRHERRDREDQGDEPWIVLSGRRAARIPARVGIGHRTLTEGVTDIPGPSSRFGCLSKTSLTGKR